MSITATIFLLISAVTHAGWNFISKKVHPSQAFFLVSNTIGVICVLPILFYFRSLIPLVPPAVWVLVVVSGLFLAAYLATLSGAYLSGDISIAYPLARSLPVIFIFFGHLYFWKRISDKRAAHIRYPSCGGWLCNTSPEYLWQFSLE